MEFNWLKYLYIDKTTGFDSEGISLGQIYSFVDQSNLSWYATNIRYRERMVSPAEMTYR